MDKDDDGEDGEGEEDAMAIWCQRGREGKAQGG